MNILSIKFNEMKGQLTLDRTTEEMQEIAELFKRKLKLNKYTYYIDTAKDIHFNTKAKSVDIIERANNKFIVVKENEYGNREFNYYELVG
jgi:hypothetical protein